MEELDLLVIGAGPGGYVCAIRAAQLSLKTACIEQRDTLGGTCLNVGCIPSKALLESSHQFEKAKKEFVDHGISFDSLTLNMEKLQARKDKVVAGITKGVEFLLKKNNVAWINGSGKLLSKGKVEVTSATGQISQHHAKHIVLATGSTPIEIPFLSYDGINIVDSTGALNFSQPPQHLLVVGGGVIGLEIGSIWLRLGSQVTIIEAAEEILGQEDQAISREMRKCLERQGMKFLLNTKVTNGKKLVDKIRLECAKASQEDSPFELEGDKVLVAIGRRPCIDGLGLDNLSIQLDDHKKIRIDQKFQTSCQGIYAIGDLVPGPMLAHKAEEEGIALAELLNGQHGHVNYESIPSVVYTWPEVASVGLTEQQCISKSIDHKIGKFQFKANGRAKAVGDDTGFVKVIANKATDKLLGVHIIGPSASELIAEVALAFEYGASSEDIARTVHAHPTLSEAIKEAALDVDKLAIHQ